MKQIPQGEDEYNLKNETWTIPTKPSPAHLWFRCHLMQEASCELIQDTTKNKQKTKGTLPVIMTSLNIYPFTKLWYLLPGSSIPRPYEGNGSTISQWDGSLTSMTSNFKAKIVENHTVKLSNNHNTWDPRMTAPFSRKRVRWLVRLKLPVSHRPGGT